jgi:hypothetical protein
MATQECTRRAAGRRMKWEIEIPQHEAHTRAYYRSLFILGNWTAQTTSLHNKYFLDFVRIA